MIIRCRIPINRHALLRPRRIVNAEPGKLGRSSKRTEFVSAADTWENAERSGGGDGWQMKKICTADFKNR